MQDIIVKGKKLSIIGGGSSGISAAFLLHSKGAEVFLSEIEDTEKKRIEFSELDSRNIKYELGKHTPERILDSEIIIISTKNLSDCRQKGGIFTIAKCVFSLKTLNITHSDVFRQKLKIK